MRSAILLHELMKDINASLIKQKAENILDVEEI